jgi:hypothetical protein
MISFEDTNTLDDCGLGTITRTWTAIDCAGNSSSASQTVTISDDTAPAIEGVGGAIAVECPEGYEFSTPLAVDACDEEAMISFADTNTLDDCGLGTITRTWTAIDCAGNSSSASQTVTISDDTAPAIEGVGGAIAVECPEGYEFSMPLAVDACDEEVMISFEDTNTLDDCGLGTITRTWTATDCSGNSSSASQTVTISDDTAPAIEGVGDAIAVECPEDYEFSMPLAVDACDQGATISFEDTNTLDDCGLGTITRTWTATDCAGNSSNASQTVTISDDTAPAIEGVGGAIAVECPEGYEFSMPLAVDACDEEATISFADTNTLDDCGLGTVTRTWTATDCAGNSSSASQTVTISDETDPEFNEALPMDVTYQCDAVEPMAVLTAMDACDTEVEVIPTEVKTDGHCIGNYTLLRTWTVTDCAGNSAQYSQNVTVIDETAPELVGELPQGASNLDLCFANRPEGPSEADIAALFNDNCGSVVVTKTESAPQEDDCNWAVMYRYEIQDDCGNTANPVKVFYNGGDQSAPLLIGTLPEGITGLQCLSDNPGAPSLDALQEAYIDNCGAVTVTPLELVITGDDCVGWTATYEYTVVDACENQAANIVIVNSGADTMAPVLEGEIPMGANTLNLCIDSDLEEPSVEQIALLYSDNCSDVTVTKIEKVYGTDCEWIRVFEYVAEDACGNKSDVVKVNYQGGDTSAPLPTGECDNETMIIGTEDGAVCPQEASISLNIGDEISAEDNSWTVAGISVAQMNGSLVPCFYDNCAEIDELTFRVIDKGVEAGDCSTTLTVTFEVEDNCENVSEPFLCTFIIIDDTAPVVECAEDVDFGIVIEAPTAFADKAPYTDNCQANGLTLDYTDVLTSVINEGTDNSGITFDCLSGGSPFVIPFAAPTGTDQNGYNLYDNVQPDTSFYSLIFIADNNRWEIQNVGNEIIAVSNVTTLAPSCDIADWTDINPDCETLDVSCVEGTPTTEDFTLVRTFTANDGCDNTSTCDVVYTWTVDGSEECPGEAPVLTCVEGQDFGFVTETPTAFATSVSYTDACEDDGETSVFTDVVTEVLETTTPACSYTLQGFDWFGDGWGASLEVLVNGMVVSTYSVNGYTGDVLEIAVSDGDVISTQFVSTGSYPSDISYEIRDALGSVVATDTTNGISSFDAQCSVETGNTVSTLVRTFSYTDADTNTVACDVIYTWSTAIPCELDYPVIACGDIVTGNTSNEGVEDVTFIGGIGNWYTFVGAGDYMTVLSTCNTADYDTRIDIYTDCGDTFVNGNDDADGCSGFSSEVDFFAEDGVVYQIFMRGYEDSTGNYELSVECGYVYEEELRQAEEAVKIDFTAFPVPFDNEVNIAYSFEFDTNVTIELFDTKGLQVYSETNKNYVTGSNGKSTFDLSRYSSQMFYVKLTTSQGSVIKKIVSSGKK